MHRTHFTLFRQCGTVLSEITKAIDGAHTHEEVKRLVDVDQHCKDLMADGWTLDLWSVRHYVISSEPIER